MAQLGLDADEDPGQAHDVEVRLALSVRRLGPQAVGRGAMQVRADGRVLEVWSTPEHASPPDELPRQLARELVEELACSPRVAAHADALYGRRTRPLRETTGRSGTCKRSYWVDVARVTTPGISRPSSKKRTFAPRT